MISGIFGASKYIFNDNGDLSHLYLMPENIHKKINDVFLYLFVAGAGTRNYFLLKMFAFCGCGVILTGEYS